MSRIARAYPDQPDLWDQPARVLTMEQAHARGEHGMTVASENAGAVFREQAKSYILTFLANHGQASAEDIVDRAANVAGLVPPSGEARAWGAPFNTLSRQGKIVAAGMTRRRKGNGVRGATVWRLA